MVKLIEIANEFGEIIFPLKKSLSIEDIMLYGSLATKKENPGDVDILLIHKNPYFTPSFIGSIINDLS